MLKMKRVIPFVILLPLFFLNISHADPVIWTSGNYEIRVDNEWYHIIELQTFNDVTVNMFIGTSVNQFYMHDNSFLTTYEGTIHSLYLYDNTNVLFLGGNPGDLYIDPISTAQVKLSAYDTRFEPSDPSNDPSGPGTLYGTWLSNDMSFNINLTGTGAYSHVQITPEPATLLLLVLGGLIHFRRGKIR